MVRLLCVLSTVAALPAARAVSSKERPVAKVVRLLQDMGTQLQADLEDDEAVHEKLACWCTTNEKEKTASIEAGQAKQSELEAFLGEAAAKAAELKSKRDVTLDEVNKDVVALQEASAIRMKESKHTHEEEMNLVEAVKACDQALVVLGEHNAAFSQVQAVAHKLQTSKVLELGRQYAASATSLLALRTFMSRLQGVGGASFLAGPHESYAPQSGQVFGVLSQMKADFAEDLSDLRTSEAKKAAEFKKLTAAKKEEIAAGRKLQADLDQEVAEVKEKHAQAFQELGDTKQQLDMDGTFMQKLEAKCSVSDEEFEQRVKDRQAEISAVQDTVKILNDDAAYETFGKAVNSFVQLSSVSSSQQRLSRVAELLTRAAAASGEPALSLLATRAQLDTFAKVKEEIGKMMVQLKKQQQDEIEHRDWCTAELNTNERETQAGYDTKTSLETKVADLKKSIEYLEQEIQAATAAVQEMQVQMRRASENREAENAQFQQSMSDQQLAQMFLGKALARMRQVYAMLQQSAGDEPGAPHVQMVASKDDPGNGPARFNKYEQHSGGGKVLAMIEEVIADSRTTEDAAVKSEQDDQAAYENFMKDSNKAIVVYGQKITNLKSSLAGSAEELSMSSSDLKASVGSLSDLHEELGNLRKSCEFIMKTFDDRQAARAAELDSLSEAKAILSGMK